MSVTFFIHGEPTGEYTAGCYDEVTGRSVEVVREDSYEDAVKACDAHTKTCMECATHGIYVHEEVDVHDTFDVNLANINAIMLLERLGIEEDDLTGSMSGGEFLGHVLTAIAMNDDDSGVPDVREGNITHCGVPAGYWAEKFSRLHDLAQEAARLRRDVVWS